MSEREPQFAHQQLAFALRKVIDEAHVGGHEPSMIRVSLYTLEAVIEALCAPASAGRLTKPAQVGNTIFGEGVEERIVIERAHREHDYQQTPERQAERMGRLKAFQQAVSSCNRCGGLGYICTTDGLGAGSKMPCGCKAVNAIPAYAAPQLTRYALVEDDEGYAFLEPNSDGKWVKFSDLAPASSVGPYEPPMVYDPNQGKMVKPGSGRTNWIQEELRDGDRICEAAGVRRTEGGRLPVAKIINKLNAIPSASEPSEEAVIAAAKVIAESPLIDAPRLKFPAWLGLARHVLESARATEGATK